MPFAAWTLTVRASRANGRARSKRLASGRAATKNANRTGTLRTTFAADHPRRAMRATPRRKESVPQTSKYRRAVARIPTSETFLTSKTQILCAAIRRAQTPPTSLDAPYHLTVRRSLYRFQTPGPSVVTAPIPMTLLTTDSAHTSCHRATLTVTANSTTLASRWAMAATTWAAPVQSRTEKWRR